MVLIENSYEKHVVMLGHITQTYTHSLTHTHKPKTQREERQMRNEIIEKK